MPLFNWLAATSAAAFASQVGTKVADDLPGFVKNSVKLLSNEFEKHSPPEISWVRKAVPKNQLRSLVYALHLDSEDNLLASSVHDVEVAGGLIIPAIVQLALNSLVLHEAGYRGQFFQAIPKKKVTAARFSQLRQEHSLIAISKLSGSNQIHKTAKWTALTSGDQHIDIEWRPSKNQLADCSLIVSKGQKPEGRDPLWSTQVSFAIPFRYIFKVT
ncbi:MAG TPA: hypothetical protein VGB75_13185 [Jatrophihabitans sp.]|jgi:hypothetical protein|uniref:hypothetical protein n=1 Tax=Jatrophihabitans sp. TaxID=1932789 RepID=UPI002F04024B